MASGYFFHQQYYNYDIRPKTPPAGTSKNVGRGGVTIGTQDQTFEIPSRELTYPTLGKGTSSSKMPFFAGDMFVPRRVNEVFLYTSYFRVMFFEGEKKWREASAEGFLNHFCSL